MKPVLLFVLTMFAGPAFAEEVDPWVRASNGGVSAEAPSLATAGGSFKIVRVRVANVAPDTTVEGSIDGLPSAFFPHESGPPGEFLALIPVPFGQRKGNYSLEITVKSGKSQTELSLPFAIAESGDENDIEVLEAGDEEVRPGKKLTVEKVISEESELDDLYRVVTRKRMWRGPFLVPLVGKTTSPFGRYRIYSSHVRRRIHWGVDLKAPVGTIARASAAGKVALAKDLTFAGKTIIIDHGYGLYSEYAHLKSTGLKVGDTVTAGQIVGRSGITGKTTGPHLHWQFVLNQVKINPYRFTELTEPLVADPTPKITAR